MVRAIFLLYYSIYIFFFFDGHETNRLSVVEVDGLDLAFVITGFWRQFMHVRVARGRK